MGIAAYVIKKYYEYYPLQEKLGWAAANMDPMEKLYSRVGDKICFGCKEYQLCKPQTGSKGEDADLLYCRKCEIFYSGKQYEILSNSLQNKVINA
jgi:hypothetical protein